MDFRYTLRDESRLRIYDEFRHVHPGDESAEYQDVHCYLSEKFAFLQVVFKDFNSYKRNYVHMDNMHYGDSHGITLV